MRGDPADEQAGGHDQSDVPEDVTEDEDLVANRVDPVDVEHVSPEISEQPQEEPAADECTTGGRNPHWPVPIERVVR